MLVVSLGYPYTLGVSWGSLKAKWKIKQGKLQKSCEANAKKVLFQYLCIMKITVYEDTWDRENNSIYIDRYIVFFMDKLQDRIPMEDGTSILENEMASHIFLSNLLKKNIWGLDDFKKWLADDKLDELHQEITKNGMELCPLNFFTLCQYILNLIKSQYFALLKPTIADTLAELKDVKSVSFVNGDNKTISTSNTEAVKLILNSLKENSKNTLEVGKLISVDKIADKALIQASFAYNVSLFLKQYFSNYPRRANCCMVSSIEQKLILYMLYFFGLSPVPLTDSRFRQLIKYYNEHRCRITVVRMPEVGYVPIEFVKYNDWKNGIDLDNIPPLKIGDTVSFSPDCMTNSFF